MTGGILSSRNASKQSQSQLHATINATRENSIVSYNILLTFGQQAENKVTRFCNIMLCSTMLQYVALK